MDYTTASLADVSNGLDDIARDAQATFGRYDSPQLNWRPDATRWSVAQCFEHLLTANRLMFEAADSALNEATRPTRWQRMPMLPGVFGRMLVRSQAPSTARKFTAPPKAQPSTSDIPVDVIQRFIEQQRHAVLCVQALDEPIAARTIMASPFIRFITYSVLDGWRLVFAHNRRHFEQARAVTRSPGFPNL
jgi:hypothetical protein